MRTFFVMVAFVGFGALYAYQRHTDHRAVASVQNEPATSQVTAASPRPATMWPKKSLDRAHEVANQVQQQRKANDNP